MHNSVDNLISIKKEIQLKNKKTEIVAVSKTFPINDILPLINHGHKHYGENKVQEAIGKWQDIKFDFTDIKLHLIGKLQTNKVKHVIPLFDYIHSLDSIKLAEKISTEQEKKNFRPKIFIQVNIGNESQKNGVDLSNLDEFIVNCKKNLNLDIIGLMCIPPLIGDSKNFFSKMSDLAKVSQLNELSMGMSSDYLEAIDFNSSFVRIGSKIFGERF
ncbi:YggS family pyridoxal phosphate-dependent enzyme [Pelagibacteraceae bacterium]|jgi:pyridoxal phosphate enzyme (YggS family)|nr:YggS family pyridoxal phosphate-dependent enzyme [Pelagibacteraceae bacterium]|tara:strand:- start:128 stop:772 length:645 start_codon:yes stop_codon:yes gene_type:complete